jgi:APA family basic amino acid/polyamine antiporter
LIFSTVCFLGLSVSTLFRLKDPVRRWWYPTAPIIFILCVAAIAFLILAHNPIPALVGVGVVLAGEVLRRRLVSAKAVPVRTTDSSLP